MSSLLEVILPVFLVIGAGYGAVWAKVFKDEWVDGLMKFAQNFAIPCLLFTGIANLDLGAEFNAPLLISFYAGAVAGFLVAMLGARFLFGRAWEDSVAIGFVGLFSNSVLLGLPISERAFGTDALAWNYAIISIHAPFAYFIGITTMEVVKSRGGSPWVTTKRVLNAMFHNALVIGIGLGFIVNLGQIPLPGVLTDALGLMTRAALPAALFGLGGVLYRYRPEGDTRQIAFLIAVSLLLHPLITWSLGTAFELPTEAFRAAVLTATMAPGINTYIFANMYGVARRVAASTVLFGTAISILTVWAWLAVLP